ncbi:Nipped-B-Like Protein [Manis pentadactyla]|nr:Nipped-B-Like Protein [Manis pentadactyla]
MDATLPEEPSDHLIGGANFISKQHLYFRKSEFQQERGKKEPERDRTKSAPLKALLLESFQPLWMMPRIHFAKTVITLLDHCLVKWKT